jgi:hypothetical protein
MFVLAAVAAVAALLKPTREFCEESKIGTKATYVHVVRGCSRIKKMRTLKLVLYDRELGRKPT